MDSLLQRKQEVWCKSQPTSSNIRARTREILPPNPTLPVPKCIRTISGNHTLEGFMLLWYDFSEIYKIGLLAENTMVGLWALALGERRRPKKHFRSGRFFYIGICRRQGCSNGCLQHLSACTYRTQYVVTCCSCCKYPMYGWAPMTKICQGQYATHNFNLGWEFRCSVLISGTPMGSRSPIPKILVRFFFSNSAVEKLRNWNSDSEIWNSKKINVGIQYTSSCMGCQS